MPRSCSCRAGQQAGSHRRSPAAAEDGPSLAPAPAHVLNFLAALEFAYAAQHAQRRPRRSRSRLHDQCRDIPDDHAKWSSPGNPRDGYNLVLARRGFVPCEGPTASAQTSTRSWATSALPGAEEQFAHPAGDRLHVDQTGAAAVGDTGQRPGTPGQVHAFYVHPLSLTSATGAFSPPPGPWIFRLRAWTRASC